jgi:hypothetical protein
MFSRRKKHGKINWSRNRLLLNQLIICDQVDKYLEIYVYPTMVGGGLISWIELPMKSAKIGTGTSFI